MDKTRKLVLCVDDETIGLGVRKQILQTQGYRVLTAPDGPEGLTLFAAEPIDLVVLDFKMPGMNGDVVAEAMKSAKPAVPILMLSAYLDIPQETLSLVDAFITKGNPVAELLETVAQLLDGSSNVKPQSESKTSVGEKCRSTSQL